MLRQNVAIRRNDLWSARAGGALKTFLLTGLTAAVLSLGIGLTIAGATAAVLGITAGGLGVAHQSCQRAEANLAADLGLSAAALRMADPATLDDRIVARRDAGELTTFAANRASDRVAAYAGCRSQFLRPTSAR